MTSTGIILSIFCVVAITTLAAAQKGSTVRKSQSPAKLSGRPCVTETNDPGTCMAEKECKGRPKVVHECDSSTICCPNSPGKERSATNRNSARAGYHGNCGIRPTTNLPDPNRLVDGTEVVPYSWPWMASLEYNGGHTCGSSVITPYHVVTAAHCFYSTEEGTKKKIPIFGNPSDFGVRVNAHTAQSDGKVYRVSSIKLHDNYGPHTNDDDIAIVKVEDDMMKTTKVTPVCLPSPNSDLENTGNEVMVTGWGAKEFQGEITRRLEEIMIHVVDNEECIRKFPRIISNKMLCAASPDWKKDACQADSGGPLVTDDDEDEQRWFLIGVVSFGEGCATPNYPGVYTRISMYLDWIEANSRY